MKIKNIILFLFSLFLLLFPLYAFADMRCYQSTSKDQDNITITIYNNNTGLIRETRTISIPPGTDTLQFLDVPSSIMPETVRAKPRTNFIRFRILEQTYEYDLMDSTRLLDKYVGKTLKLAEWNKAHDRKETVEATLLSNHQEQIYEIDGEIYVGHSGLKILPQLPENFVVKPTLTWLYENENTSPFLLDVSYLTESINWKADYTMILNKDDTSSALTAWITIDNKSGTMYKNANLKLMAGKIHRAERNTITREYDTLTLQKSASTPFAEQPFFEYHLYGLEDRTTIKDRQTKQIRFFDKLDIPVRKEFLLYGNRKFFTRSHARQKTHIPVTVHVSFSNTKANHLGLPLPEGTVRLYKQDSSGHEQFIGEDIILHTPENEHVSFQIGNAFDIVAERTQIDFQQIATNLYETEWLIHINNHKKTSAVVGVIEPLFGNWTVISNNKPFTKVDAFTIRFDPEIPAEGETTIRYRLRISM